MNKRKVIISIIFTFLVLLVGTLIFQKLSKQKASTISPTIEKKALRKVQVKSFEKSSNANIITADGRLVPFETVELFSKVNGVIETVNKSFKPGTYYAKGEVIFTLNKQEETYSLYAQRSQLLNSITQIMPDLKFDYPEAFSKWENYLNQFDVEQSTKELPTTNGDKEKFFVASKNIYNIYYNIKSIETRLREYTITAPISGVITNSNVYSGVLVRPGMSMGTMISQSQFELEAPISLVDLKYISLGQSVALSSSEISKTWNGTVKRIGSKIDDKTQYIPIYIQVSGSDLKQGMYLKGEIKGKSLDNIVKIDGNYMPDQSSVFIIQDSIIVKKSIEVVKRDQGNIYTRSIEPSDVIITDVLTGLYAGQKVIAIN